GMGVLPDRQAADAISACQRALRIREELGESAAVSANHHALSVYQWYSANRRLAEGHAEDAMTVLDDGCDDAYQLVQLGQAFAMQAYLAVQASDLDMAASLIGRAREIADKTGDFALGIRVRLIESYGSVLNGDESGRDEILAIVNSGPSTSTSCIRAGGATSRTSTWSSAGLTRRPSCSTSASR
ncbi:MAG: hypothetical protein QOJ24_577, partial [Mycobacterium sp.]|nr:hypothetical protein [Mycobacterium sp.]